MRILDFHIHLGDILHQGGEALIYQKVPHPRGFDPDAPFRLANFHGQAFGDWLYKFKPLADALAAGERRRNAASTLEHYLTYRKKRGLSYACAMPIAPNVPFEALLALSQEHPHILPFGSIDFAQGDIAGQVQRQLEQGAWGFKLHPILQRVDPLGVEAQTFFAACPPNTVVLTHTGVAQYYTPEEQHLERPEYGQMSTLLEMARRNRHIKLVLAHAGWQDCPMLLEALVDLEQVYVDTSFARASRLRNLARVLGPQRLLFASDWPYGFIKTSQGCLKEAFGHDQGIMERILWKNGMELLRQANPGRALPDIPDEDNA